MRDSSFTEPNGDRVLQESIEVASPPACLWRAWTDEAAIKASGLAMAHVDLRNGGVIEEGFSAAAAPGSAQVIRHRIIAYLPERLLVLRNEATPPGLPHPELYRTIVQVDSLEPLAESRTRVTISHTGYGSGPDYDQLYAFFRRGNAAYLAQMKATCEKR
ncbi:MAG TPA: SRPBCC domain-containing protein [Caulobacteraceae bacterium]|nr:SRPBCC domain-containing protein [Caulobacteraceae bacterium]